MPIDIPLCRKCGIRQSMPSRLRKRDRLCARCYIRRGSSLRYRQSAKYRANQARYNASPAGKARMRRFDATAARQRKKQTLRKRRVYIGQRVVYHAATPQDAARINAVIRSRLDAFVAIQRSAHVPL